MTSTSGTANGRTAVPAVLLPKRRRPQGFWSGPKRYEYSSAVHCRRRYPSRECARQFGQPFLVAVRRFAVGDIENRRRVTFAVIPHRTPVPDQFVRMQQLRRTSASVLRQTARSAAEHLPKRASARREAAAPVAPAGAECRVHTVRRFDDQTRFPLDGNGFDPLAVMPGTAVNKIVAVTLFASAAMQQLAEEHINSSGDRLELETVRPYSGSALPSSRTGRSK